MRYIFYSCLLSVVFISIVLFAPRTENVQALSGPASIKIDSVIFKEKNEGDEAGDRLLTAKKLLDNSGNVIGNSYSVCTLIGTNGLLGKGIYECHATFNLPRGKITTQGSRHSRDRYTWIVTGGTGFYIGIGGTLDAFISGIAPRRENLIFHIQ